MEADLVKRAGVPFEAVDAAGVHGVGLRALPGNLARLSRGYLQARRILDRFRPDALFFTGGYVAVPVALAARTRPGRKPPVILYVPDIEPGLALKTLARFADHIALTTSESQAYCPRRKGQALSVTGYPTRPELTAWDYHQACRTLGVSEDLPVLLVVGGSTGAQSINRALWQVLHRLLARAQVIHLTGRLDWPQVDKVRSRLDASLSSRYIAHPYLHSEQMGAAFTAATVVLSRAGASSLGEYPLFGLPAILVPYPYAWRYQQVNAQFLAERGAAVIVQDADLPERLLDTALDLLHNPQRCEQMRQAMRSLALPDAARSIAGIIQDLALRNGLQGGSL